MPRETRFFTLFDQHGSLIAQGADSIVELVRHYGETGRREQLIRRIGGLERSADRITHEISTLHSTFITPFDRNAPLLGMLPGSMLMIGVSWLCLRSAPRRVDRWFRRLQLVSSAAYCIGHGSNDAQKTMGQKITELRPVGGFAAETGGAMTLFLASSFGIPVSTTHTITGAIVGVGSAHHTRAVRWGVAGNIAVAWIVTMPAAALMSALAYDVGKALM